MKCNFAITFIATALLTACGGGSGDSGLTNGLLPSEAVHVLEKKQLAINVDNAAVVASVIFDLEDFARAPLDMLNDPYIAPKITLPNMARTEELAVNTKYKGEFVFDGNDNALQLCANGEQYNNQPSYAVSKESHNIVDGIADNSQQAILSYWFIANHCDRITGETGNQNLAKITGAIWFTAQWVKGMSGELVNFNGVVKTAHPSTAPSPVDVPEQYPHLFINYGERNEVRFDEINTNMMISGDQFALHYGNVKLYSEFNGRGGSLTINTVKDAPIILADRYIKHEYVSGQVLIKADQDTQMLLTMDVSAVTLNITLSDGDKYTTSYSYSELYDIYYRTNSQ
ncbi:hypothetical protein CW745_02915 [Psychromonas sp. psych-6C06]|uniref:hypothetical protein n=1 Tax=Psychromonas sp. psych-6C06 TaxID=2058089 RepID=UPI000C34E519|nr:hypothetical protein [Psychromonas sp. psych-6C06]PKF63806.1 hypothetical protein CW745_02915 [Psychromonas sp. psych-6C06]